MTEKKKFYWAVIFPSEALDSIGAIPSAGAGVTGSDLVPLSPICTDLCVLEFK